MSDDLEVKSVRGALSGAAFGAGVGAGAGAIGGLIGSKDGQGASGAKRGALLGALTGGTTGAIGGGLMGGASKRINRQLLKDKPNMSSIDDAIGDFKAAHGIGGIGSTLGAATVGGVGSALHTNKKGFDAYNEGFDGSIEEKRYGANRIPKYSKKVRNLVGGNFKKGKKANVGKPMTVPV